MFNEYRMLLRLNTKPFAQLRQLANHRVSDIPNYLGLISRYAATSDLRALFPIGTHQVQADTGTQDTFAVANRNYLERLAESAIPRLTVNPSKDRCEAEALPRLEDERIRIPIAFDVREIFDEPANARGRIGLKPCTMAFPARCTRRSNASTAFRLTGKHIREVIGISPSEVVYLPLASLLDELAGRDCPGQHIVNVPVSDSKVIARHIRNPTCRRCDPSARRSIWCGMTA